MHIWYIYAASAAMHAYGFMFHSDLFLHFVPLLFRLQLNLLQMSTF